MALKKRSKESSQEPVIEAEVNKPAPYVYSGSFLLQPPPDSEVKYSFWLFVVTTIAIITRFWKLHLPKEVVFDEVHFGKFASYYLERTYFFDVHPPFAKMLIAAVGWLVGYDGSFKFDNIGDSYATNKAPYLAYRALSAIQGSITVPIVFLTMKNLNYKALTCFLAGMFIAVDNAQVIDSRLILLDATLILAVACSVYCYVRFYREQLRKAFSAQWYIWLYLTGLSLSFVISTKYVGVFTYAMIGVAVVVNLWQLMDHRAGLPIRVVCRHVAQRLNGLVIVPFVVYLFWFYVHFAVLNKSGPGDAFMSPDFQKTLGDSPLARDSKEINYYDVITFKHKDTKAFLHSHLANYPLRYDDGRISSQGQQVTGYTHADPNNEWQIIPAIDHGLMGHTLKFGDLLRLRHVATNTYLWAHDVASPLYPTNEEITTVALDKANDEFTLFVLDSPDVKNKGRVISTKAGDLKIIHHKTNVALWTHNDVTLPEWGFNQQEVNGNKKIIEKENVWVPDEIIGLTGERAKYVPKEIKQMSFINKWIEAQRLMFEHNNKLSSEHPFASQPQSWPGSLSGVSFWTQNDERKQIYFIGNIIGWWMQIVAVVVYIAIVAADLVSRRRAVYLISATSRDRLYSSMAYLIAGWATHYFPFFLMARQKFLHHYLPAHLILGMFTSAMVEFLITDNRSDDSDADEELTIGKKEGSTNNILLFVAVVAMSAAMIWFFVFMAPLTYGNTGLEAEEAMKRQWLNMGINFSK